MATRVLNLWDMLKQYSIISSWITSELTHHQQNLEADLFDKQFAFFGSLRKARQLQIDDNDLRRIECYLPHVEGIAADLHLEITALTARRIRSALESGDYLKHHLAADVKDLCGRLHDELISRQFIFIHSKFAKYYQQADLFGQEVNDCFPDAIDDIKDAGTALATGLGTSCVMHLMRVLEAALKELALGLKIEYATGWDAYLKKIEKAISENHASKTSEWLAIEKFYRDVSGDLLTIKQAWRNPVMHIERRYDQEQAEQVLLAVKVFIQRMSNQLKV